MCIPHRVAQGGPTAEQLAVSLLRGSHVLNKETPICSCFQALSLPCMQLLSTNLGTPATAAPITNHRRINIRAQQRKELKQQVQSLMDKCPLPGYCVRDAGLPTAAEYLTQPLDVGMKQQKQKVVDFIAGPGFQVSSMHF